MTFGILDTDNQERRKNMTGEELYEKLHYKQTIEERRKIRYIQIEDTESLFYPMFQSSTAY